MSLSNTVKAIQNIMRKDAGVDGDAQRIGQLGWMLFLKIYSDLELETELEDTNYKSPIPVEFRWESWADETSVGKDSRTGDALIHFINNELFPQLKDLDLSRFSGQARERGALLISVFDDAYNYMKNGTLLRQVINKINQDIDYNSVETRHLFGDIYEQILRDLQNAGNAGEYYTPRAVTQFAIEMVNPQLGEIVLDPACGTGGFLTGAFEHMKKQVKKPAELMALKNSIRGVEKKPLPHVLCATNMMIHGIEVPSNIINDNTLAKPLRDYGKSDQVDVIITNPPFGGVEEDGVENNFPAEFRTKETADLFLLLVMELLNEGGRAAIVLPDGTLFGEGVKTKIKKKMLEECNLHTVVRLPRSVFAPYTSIATNILFLTKGEPTTDVWYFEHRLPEGVKAYNKTKPMRLEEFDVEKSWWSNREESEQAWRVTATDIANNNYNLDIKNPNALAEVHEDPDELLAQYQESEKSVRELQEFLKLRLGALGENNLREKKILQNFGLFIESRLGISQLREMVLSLAVSGKFTTGASDTSNAHLTYDLNSLRLKEDRIWGREFLSDNPDHWSRLPLAKLGSWGSGGTPSKGNKEYYGGDIPWLNIGDLNDALVTSASNSITLKGLQESSASMVPTGAVLIAMYGSIGKSAIAGIECATNQAIAHCIPDTEIVSSKYLFYLIRALKSRLFARGKGLAQQNISQTTLKHLIVAVPPIDEQGLIVAIIEELMRTCDQLEKAQNLRDQIADRFARSVALSYL